MRADRPAQSLPRCGSSRQVMKKNRLDTTKRRRRDMTSHYKPNSAGHREEPFGIVMGTWIPAEPQSPNTRDSALPALPRTDATMSSAGLRVLPNNFALLFAPSGGRLKFTYLLKAMEREVTV